jgi:hypothetical protein
MQKIKTDPQLLSILPLFDDDGGSLQDAQSREAFVTRVRKALETHGKNPAAIYGSRTERMFAYVAGAMGACSTITQEDAGPFFADTPDLIRPDFHIVTKEGARFLVEVKNYSPKEQHYSSPYEFEESYLTKLEAYAQRVGRDLKIAIYWRHVEGMCTLVNARYFEKWGHKRVLSLEAAFKRNEMEVLGDCLIGTVPPLSIKVFTNPDEPRSVADDGMATFTIHRIALYAAGTEIVDPLEQEIAWFLMNHGRWTETEAPAEVEHGDLVSFEFQLTPRENENPEQEFVGVGWLSQMVSTQYRELTVADGKVATLSPNMHPAALGVVIPIEYKGTAVRLWRFRLQPNYDDLVSIAKPWKFGSEPSSV